MPAAPSLERKLGALPPARVLLDGAAADFTLAEVAVDRRPRRDGYDVILLFAPDRDRLTRQWPRLVALLAPAGRLWVCWPKRASGRQTDLSEAGVRQHGLNAGLVDVKICAVDDTWSALAFVRRRADRAD